MQQQTAHAAMQDGVLEALWGGAGGLQGYFPLTQPLETQQQQKQQQKEGETPAREDTDLQQQVHFVPLSPLQHLFLPSLSFVGGDLWMCFYGLLELHLCPLSSF